MQTRFPNPDSMIDSLHNQYNAHFMILYGLNFMKASIHIMILKNGWLYKRNIADSQRDWIAQGYVSTFYDAFNADARKGFWNLINENYITKELMHGGWMRVSLIYFPMFLRKKKRVNDSTCIRYVQQNI